LSPAGSTIFADRAISLAAKGRIVTADEVVARRPDLIIGSWCGKRFRLERVRLRPGFRDIPAVRNNALFEIKSPLILATRSGGADRWARRAGGDHRAMGRNPFLTALPAPPT
jgi:ABC-type Fe3+-hydroxamate transport system substrate-binding protein